MVSPQAVALFQTAASSTYTVTKLTDTNDGVCDKDCSLREAIAVTMPDSIIEFAAGMSGTIALKSTLTINKNLTINGPVTKQIIISGRNAIRVFYIDSGANIKIRNVTIANGSVKGKSGLVGGVRQPGSTGGTAEGAGLYNNGGVVTVENSTFLNNVVKGGSGGKGGFTAGSTEGAGGMGGDGLGGGVYNFGTLFLINSTFSENKALGGTGGDGGVNLHGASPVDIRNQASGSVVGTGGGGGNGYGGAIYSASNAWIISCTFAANSALVGTGGMSAAPSSIGGLGDGESLPGFMRLGGVQGRIASGISRPNGLPGAGLGAAIYRPGALPAGKFMAINRSNSIKIKNTLIVGDESGSNCEAAIDSEGYNISNDGTCHLTAAGDQLITNITLKPLTYSGGPASTYALPAGSPAVNGGNPAGCTDHNGIVILTDQRGQSRTWGGRCDIGAFEFGVEPQK